VGTFLERRLIHQKGADSLAAVCVKVASAMQSIKCFCTKSLSKYVPAQAETRNPKTVRLQWPEREKPFPLKAQKKKQKQNTLGEPRVSTAAVVRAKASDWEI
jgi:hypothetical protein